jgi:hypothetical protein
MEWKIRSLVSMRNKLRVHVSRAEACNMTHIRPIVLHAYCFMMTSAADANTCCIPMTAHASVKRKTWQRRSGIQTRADMRANVVYAHANKDIERSNSVDACTCKSVTCVQLTTCPLPYHASEVVAATTTIQQATTERAYIDSSTRQRQHALAM